MGSWFLRSQCGRQSDFVGGTRKFLSVLDQLFQLLQRHKSLLTNQPSRRDSGSDRPNPGTEVPGYFRAPLTGRKQNYAFATAACRSLKKRSLNSFRVLFMSDLMESSSAFFSSIAFSTAGFMVST